MWPFSKKKINIDAEADAAWEMHRRCALMNYGHLYLLKNEGGISEIEFKAICQRQSRAIFECDVSQVAPIERPGFKGIKYSYLDAAKLLYIAISDEMAIDFDENYILLSKVVREKILDDNPQRVRQDFITYSAFLRSQALANLMDDESAMALEVRVIGVLVEKHGECEFEFYNDLKMAWLASMSEGSNPLFGTANKIVQRIWWRLKFMSDFKIHPILETSFNETAIRKSYGFWPKLTSACGLLPDSD